MRGPHILLRSGNLWYPLDPHPSEVHSRDFVSLGLICRWSGATHVHYSVAEHSVRVAQLLREQGHPDRAVFMGLVHDAHEVYPPGDVPGPMLRGDSVEACALRNLEKKSREVLRVAIGVPLEFPDEVRQADLALLAQEGRDLMPMYPWKGLPDPPKERIFPWTSERAIETWMGMYEELGGVAL